MKKILLLSLLILAINQLFAQIEIRDSVFVKINKLEPSQYSFGIYDGKIGLIHIYTKNRYESETGYTSGQFGSNLILKQKHKLDPKKILSYDEYVNLINKNLMDVYLHYKVYFILSEAKYDYLTLQVRQIVQYQE